MHAKKLRLFNLDFDNLAMNEAVEYIIRDFAAVRRRAMVVTPNVDHIVQLDRDIGFRDAYSKADIILADGFPLIAASRILGRPLKERVAGSDIFPRLCESAAKAGLRVMLLGGGEGVAAKAAENLAAKFDGLQIASIGPSFGFDEKSDECGDIVARINEFEPHLLFVGVGAPRQEHWISRYQESYVPCVSVGVGGSLDFEAGRIRRAPKALRAMGFEWLYRLVKEPKRLYKRYLIDDRRFFALLLREIKALHSTGPA